MLKQMEGSRAVAEAVALCRPEVISAYPISPQTHIVEHLSDIVRTGDLSPCEYLKVESEFAASPSRSGHPPPARAPTPRRPPGPPFMAEAVYNASGLGLPIVMTMAARSGPRSTSHSDSMSMRATPAGSSFLRRPTRRRSTCTSRPSVLPKRCRCPVMVCMDGFILTHAYERVDIPDAGAGRRLPPALRAAADARPRRTA